MYLRGKQYISYDNPVRQQFAKALGFEGLEVTQAIVELGYWRKSNQIHNWFVENVQSGNDDCGFYMVTKDNLNKLLDLCNQVLNDHTKAAELLPSKPGFFFGSTNYDSYYFDDLNQTVKILERALKLYENHMMEIFYNSSW